MNEKVINFEERKRPATRQLKVKRLSGGLDQRLSPPVSRILTKLLELEEVGDPCYLLTVEDFVDGYLEAAKGPNPPPVW